MYSKFKFTPTNSFYGSTLNEHLTAGNKIYDQHRKEVQDWLSDCISEEGVINGTELKNNWFSISPKDVFISHSHKDINKVVAFAGWLHDVFGLTAFIDSCSWGFCDDLLKKIDDRYCYNKGNRTYKYNLRNYTTSHVHMMLSTALTEMMEQTECIIFFNTPNSINMADEIKKIEKKEKTESPWIYHELLMTSLLRQRQPQRDFPLKESLRSQRIQDHFSISYDVDKYLKELITLSGNDLMNWANAWRIEHNHRKPHPLDVLYETMIKKQV